MDEAVSEEYIKNKRIAGLLHKIHYGETMQYLSVSQKLPLDNELRELPGVGRLLNMREVLAHNYCDPTTTDEKKQQIIETVKIIHREIVEIFGLYY